MADALELDLEQSRGQRVTAWATGLLMAFVAVMTFREAWLQGQRGSMIWVRAAFQLLQGWVMFSAVSLIDAHRLLVQDGVLQVAPRIQKVPLLRRWAKQNLTVPLAEVAMEWIGPVLTLQNPDSGLSLRLGYRKGAGEKIADWLVARGARPPVGA